MTKPHLRLVGAPTPDMSDSPRDTGVFVYRMSYCPDCGNWTKQARKILESVSGVREASTFWFCMKHKAQIDE